MRDGQVLGKPSAQASQASAGLSGDKLKVS